MNGFENNAIPTRNLALVAFVAFSFERFYETAEGVFFQCGDVIEDAFSLVGRYHFKLSCGAVVTVDDPSHVGVGRA